MEVSLFFLKIWISASPLIRQVDMYRIRMKGSFDSAHHLNNYVGPCSNVHGHTWVFEVTFVFKGKLDKADISVDFKKVKEVIKDIEKMFDHKDLNTLFHDENPTAEVISARLFYYFDKELASAVPALTVEKIALWETPNNCIEYTEGE